MRTKLKEGEYYMTRDGKHLVGPMVMNIDDDSPSKVYPMLGKSYYLPDRGKSFGNWSYTLKGKYIHDEKMPVEEDLVRLATPEEIAKISKITNTAKKRVRNRKKIVMAPKDETTAVDEASEPERIEPVKVEELPEMIGVPVEENFVVLTRWQADYLQTLIQAISCPRIAVRNLSTNKARAYEEALERSAENANTMWRILSDANVIPPPSPGYGVETEADIKFREEANRASVMNNQLRSAYARRQYVKNSNRAQG
jgi:hypothetical protein